LQDTDFETVDCFLLFKTGQKIKINNAGRKQGTFESSVTLFTYLFRVCLDDESINVKIILFGLVAENSMRLVIFREI
jgi:hypothetical protein